MRCDRGSSAGVVGPRLFRSRPGAGEPRRALFYIALVTVLGLLWSGYDPIRQTQSELGAVGAPHADAMNVAGFMGFGVTLLAFAAAYLLLLQGGWAKALVVLLLAGGGVGLVVVGFFPCDAGCVDVTRTGELHSFWSMPGAVGLPAAMMASSHVFWHDGRFTPVWSTVAFWLGVATLASRPIVAAELIPDADGALQRAAMWTPAPWVSLVSWKLRTLGDGPGGPVSTRRSRSRPESG